LGKPRGFNGERNPRVKIRTQRWSIVGKERKAGIVNGFGQSSNDLKFDRFEGKGGILKEIP
jgi:hypothetical protein